MSLWKRAYLHTIRKKGKTVLMFLILLIISTMILTCLSIRSATEQAALNIRKSLMGSFTVNATHLDDFLEESTVNNILKIPGVSKYNLRSYYNAEYRNVNGEKLNIKINDTMLPSKGFEHVGKIIAATDSREDSYFKESGFKLQEGRHLNKNDKQAVLVSHDFAKRNNLKLGDSILLGDNDLHKEEKVKIIGIFKPTQLQKNSETSSAEQLYENIGFIDHQTYSQFHFDDDRMHYQYGDFYVNDPAELDSIITKVKDISGVLWEKCNFTKNDADYQNAKLQLESLQNLVTFLVIALIIISIMMLVFILLLWIRNRVQEMGMMMAMGIYKKSIFSQFLVEMLMIAVFAFGLSYGTSSLLTQSVGDILFDQNTAEQVKTNNLTTGTSKNIKKEKGNALELIDVKVSLQDLGLLYIIGMGMITVSITFASYPIMHLKPKQILVKLS